MLKKPRNNNMDKIAKINRIAEIVANDQISSRGEFKEYVENSLYDKLNYIGVWEGMDVYNADTNGNDHLYQCHIFVTDERVLYTDESYSDMYYDKGDDWELEVDDFRAYPAFEFPFSKKDFEEWFDKRVDDGLEEGRKALEARQGNQKQADAEDGDSENELEDLEVGMGYVTLSNGDKVCKCYIPDWSLSYLVNGDSSGIEDEDKKIVDDWYKRNNIILVNPIDGTEEDFIAHPEFGGGSSCMVCYVHFK